MTDEFKNKAGLIKALADRRWQLLSTEEVVNRNDIRGITSALTSLVMRPKKLHVIILERE